MIKHILKIILAALLVGAIAAPFQAQASPKRGPMKATAILAVRFYPANLSPNIPVWFRQSCPPGGQNAIHRQ